MLVEDNADDVDLPRRHSTNCHMVNKMVAADDGQEALEYLFKREFTKVKREFTKGPTQP